uniref:Disease resistance R13L4/SHOC-2-like LRR domain-containing protein n=1 Tax=Trichogramma kaykai TaxID=54128 RepID=A0ABD2WSX8_9HYME
MSRNHKDKYESSNPRRTHTIMTPDEAASGKKSFWPEIEITGSVRNLSPHLWTLTHLTALYLNDNSLQRIPAEIGRLVNLRVLDLSSNKLRSLPAELGELIYLKELLLNQNFLRVLPYELGKLFQLQILGLHGNPLSKDVMAIYGEPQGTHKLLSYMLDNLSGEWHRYCYIIYVWFSTQAGSLCFWPNVRRTSRSAYEMFIITAAAAAACENLLPICVCQYSQARQEVQVVSLFENLQVCEGSAAASPRLGSRFGHPVWNNYVLSRSSSYYSSLSVRTFLC